MNAGTLELCSCAGTVPPVVAAGSTCERALLAGGRCVTAFISHRFPSAGPDLSHDDSDATDSGTPAELSRCA